MKIFGITIELKFTLGQVVTAVLIVVGGLVWLGGTYVKLQAMESKLEQVPTRNELSPVFESMDKNIGLITQLVITHVTQTGPVTPQGQGLSLTPPSRQSGSRHPDSLYTNTPHRR